MFNISSIKSNSKKVIFTKVSQTLNFTAKSKTLITLSLVIGTLFSFTLAPVSIVTALQNENNQTTQLNQIQFEPSVDLQDVKQYLDSRQFDNLKYASVTAQLETNNHIIPLNIDYNLKDVNKTIESYNNQKKAIVEGIRKSKEDKTKAQTPEAIQAIKAEKEKQKKDLLEGFKQPLLTVLGATPVPQQQPSEADLNFFDQYGYLPPAQINEAEVRAKIKELGMPANQPIPHLDKQEKGKFSNARPEDREAIMTAQEKADRDEKLADQKIQEDLVDQTDEVNLQSIEKSTPTNSTIKVSQLTYFTNVGDNTAQIVATNNNKPNKKQGNKSDVVKVQIKNQLTTKLKKVKLEDNIKQTVTQDITGQFKQSKEEEEKVKDVQEKDKQEYLQRAKTGKMQHNKMEQEMYAKEGITVDAIEDSNLITNQPKKTSFVGDLLSLGGLKAQARGLNNARYSLVIYANQNTGLAFHADTQNNWQQLKLRSNYGSYGDQRWCFDNDNNKIYLTGESSCYGTYGKKCIHALGGANYGGSVGLYDCSFQNGTDPNQKWIFDEEGRISLIYRPDMCIENASGLTNGNNMVMWGCGTGANKRNQDYRAGYSNYGTNMGMTIWSGYQAGNSFVQNTQGHSWVELWNTYGTHNTFSKWDNPSPYKDYDCSTQQYYGSVLFTKNNNICDSDAISVDHPGERIAIYQNTDYRTAAYLPKEQWDFIVFSSGYRNNWYNGLRSDLGGYGTYDWYNPLTSKSRINGYNAYYVFNSTGYCTGYSLAMWNTFKGYYGGKNLYTGSNPTPYQLAVAIAN